MRAARPAEYKTAQLLGDTQLTLLLNTAFSRVCGGVPNVLALYDVCVVVVTSEKHWPDLKLSAVGPLSPVVALSGTARHIR